MRTATALFAVLLIAHAVLTVEAVKDVAEGCTAIAVSPGEWTEDAIASSLWRSLNFADCVAVVG